MSKDLAAQWLKKVLDLKPFAPVSELDKLAEEGDRVRDSLSWNTNDRANVIQIRNLLMSGSGREAKTQAERLVRNMGTASKMTAKSAAGYEWSESQVREVNRRLQDHGSEVRFYLVKSADSKAGISIGPSPKDAEEWHFIHSVVDEVLSAKG